MKIELCTFFDEDAWPKARDLSSIFMHKTFMQTGEFQKMKTVARFWPRIFIEKCAEFDFHANRATKNETITDEFYFDSSIKRWKTRKNNKANHNVMVTAQMESQELPETEFYFDITSKKWRARSLASTTNNARLSISREQQTPESIEATIAAITQVRRVFICQ